MKLKFLSSCAIAFLAAVLLASTPVEQAGAHHGSAPHFDPDDIVTLVGAVKELRFVNPHSWLHFEVENSDGATVEWRCELAGATLLTRRGWSAETLIPGEPIRVTGAMARREDNACAIRSLILADGTDISSGDLPGSESQPELVASVAAVDARPRYLDNGQPNLSGG
ncbi:MAG: DUF6152 family protein, partial [Gammaproteobacteria bacterium]